MARPLMGPEEAAAVARVLASGWVMQGPEVEAFEADFARAVGAPHAAAVSSGTAALHLALLAVGVRPGDEVVTVSHSFIATANSVRLCGATPVFVDIEAGTFNMDPARVEAAITPHTRAILCVHQMGMPCDLAAIGAVATARGVALVEDAACAAGSEVRAGSDGAGSDGWQAIGRPHSDAACFSFHPRKLITTGDGGMVTTRDAAVDERIRAWRSHGTRDGVYGLNYRMTDLQAAVGRVQLGRLPGLVVERRRLVEELRRRLPTVAFPVEPLWARSNWQSLCVRFSSANAAAAARARLEAAGVAARPGITNAHEEPAQRDGLRAPLPESERAHRECVLLPLPSGMTADELNRVVGAVEG
ncbi:MAG: DegT/DnrJ/EryC1/StrS aminotransferase [Myxococcales bacterium]|nr:DegT/DnrJ/EryC1/StrS aminotransferase [Myxococcales bacterium]